MSLIEARSGLLPLDWRNTVGLLAGVGGVGVGGGAVGLEHRPSLGPAGGAAAGGVGGDR